MPGRCRQVSHMHGAVDFREGPTDFLRAKKDFLVQHNLYAIYVRDAKEYKRPPGQVSLTEVTRHKKVERRRLFLRHLTEFRKMSCRQLTYQILARLPREIRNMIYAVMIDRGHPCRDEVQIKSAAHERHLGPLSFDDPEFPPGLCKLSLIHTYWFCWDQQYCAAGFIKELAETAYREKTYKFRQEDLYLLPAFLGQVPSSVVTQDPQKAIVPTKEVSRLVICLRPTGNGWSFTEENLRAMLAFQRKVKVEFILDKTLNLLSGTDQEINAMISEYATLFPLISCLRGQGNTVNVRFGLVTSTPAAGTAHPALGVRSIEAWADVAQTMLNEVSVHIYDRS